MNGLSRRTLIQGAGAGAIVGAVPGSKGRALAADDSATIGWPSDVPSWDPNQRFVPDAQSMFKMVFDQPLDQDRKLDAGPAACSRSGRCPPTAARSRAEMRDDVVFHNGDKMTADDFRYTFFDRIKARRTRSIRRTSGARSPTSRRRRRTRVVMHLDIAAPTTPNWLAFLGSFIVPKAYMEKVGRRRVPRQAGRQRALQAGGIRAELAHRAGAQRRVLGPEAEARAHHHPDHQGPVGARRRRPVRRGRPDRQRAGARGDAAQGTGGPVRASSTRSPASFCCNAATISASPTRTCASPRITRSTRRRCRKAFYAGAAVPLSMPVTPGGPGFVADFTFPYDPELSKKLLAKSRLRAGQAREDALASTNGQFPSDYDIARAIVQMWKKVGIDAEVDVIEYSKYFELNRGGKLPETTLYTFDNATNDPEIYAYTLNPKLPFTPWKGMEIGQKVLDLLQVVRRHEGAHRRLSRGAAGSGGGGRLDPAAAERADARAQVGARLHATTATAGCSPQTMAAGADRTPAFGCCRAYARQARAADGGPDPAGRLDAAVHGAAAAAGRSGGDVDAAERDDATRSRRCGARWGSTGRSSSNTRSGSARRVHGDFGRSIHLRRPVLPLIGDTLPATLELAVAAMVIAAVLGLGGGPAAVRAARAAGGGGGGDRDDAADVHPGIPVGAAVHLRVRRGAARDAVHRPARSRICSARSSPASC